MITVVGSVDSLYSFCIIELSLPLLDAVEVADVEGFFVVVSAAGD